MMVCAPTHDNLRAVEALVKEYDIRIAIHNHGPETSTFPLRNRAGGGAPARSPLRLCMDVGHTERAGVDPVKTIPKPATGSSTCTSRILPIHQQGVSGDVGDGIIAFLSFSAAP